MYGLSIRLLWALVYAFTIVAIAIAPVPAREPRASPPPNPTTTDAPALLIHMKNSAYSPNAATIKIGQLVEFENDDEAGHTATAEDGSFDSGYLSKGQFWRTSFSQAGRILFSDIYHPSMRGSITVIVN